ncbi:MAG: hypothetical protein K0R75_683 [Paenibacillaceae bacterium]|nr:hypothetical protein [Paenibacillaceae bacterium]
MTEAGAGKVGMERRFNMTVSMEDPAAFLLLRLRSSHPAEYRQGMIAGTYGEMLADKLEMSEREKDVLVRSIRLQNIGILRIVRPTSDEILNHPVYGAETAAALGEQGLVDVEAIRHHHENIDGSGYPCGIDWRELSLNARIARIAGALAAKTALLREPRSTRPGSSKLPAALGSGRGSVPAPVAAPTPARPIWTEAMEELYRWSDMLYDGDLVVALHEALMEK